MPSFLAMIKPEKSRLTQELTWVLVKSLPATPGSHIGVPVQALATPLPVQLLANVYGKAAKDCPKTWAPAFTGVIGNFFFFKELIYTKK